MLLALVAALATLLTCPTASATATPPQLGKMGTVAPDSDALPAVLITNADKLNGYIAVKDFTSHFASFDDPYPPPAVPDLEASFVHQNQDPSTTGGRRLAPPSSPATHPHACEYAVYCTVSDPDSPYTDLVKRLGCQTLTLSHAQRSQRAEWTRVFSTVASSHPSMYLLWVPDMHDHSGTDLATALGATPPVLTHAVIWSRNGVQGPGTDDLEAFNWYRDVERNALASTLATQGKLTILRLSFALERFLDLAADIEDESALRLPIGTEGELVPISLHDAVWASHTVFQAAQRSEATQAHGFKPVMHLTSDTPVTGAAMAAAATRAFGYPVRFEAISRAAARDLLMSLENVSPQLATVLLDVFECARRKGSGCHAVASQEEVQALLPGRQVRSVEWFFGKYRDMFAPGGGM